MKKYHDLTDKQRLTAIRKVKDEEEYDIRRLFDYEFKIKNDKLQVVK